MELEAIESDNFSQLIAAMIGPLRHGAAVVTQDADFSSFGEVPVIRV